MSNILDFTLFSCYSVTHYFHSPKHTHKHSHIVLQVHTQTLHVTNLLWVLIFIKIKMRVSLGAVIGRFPFSSSSNGELDQHQNQNLEMGDVIRHDRKCRDVPFLVFFIAFWIALIVNSSFGFYKGNPLR